MNKALKYFRNVTAGICLVSGSFCMLASQENADEPVDSLKFFGGAALALTSIPIASRRSENENKLEDARQPSNQEPKKIKAWEWR